MSGDPDFPAALSSRGPTDSDAVKPDVLAPGTYILSARASKATMAFWEPQQPGPYAYLGGTSMATPVVSGCAAVLRQYLREERKLKTPSAALLKAILIASARRIRARDLPGDLRDQIGFPDYDQGFGRVDLTNVLPHKGAPAKRRLEYDDVRGDSPKALASRGTPGELAASNAYHVTVAAGAEEPLRAVLTWSDWPSDGVQNNLHLKITAPGGTAVYGNPEHWAARREADSLLQRSLPDRRAGAGARQAQQRRADRLREARRGPVDGRGAGREHAQAAPGLRGLRGRRTGLAARAGLGSELTMATGTPSPQATSTPVRFRRSATRLTAGQRQKLRDSFAAVQKIDDDRGYGYHAGIHGLPLPIGCDNAHGTDYFLPWHRAYLYFFERALRDQVPDAMLTWWDWRTGPTHAAQIPKAFATKTVDRKRNPLFSATVSPLAIQQGGNQVPATTAREPGAPGAPPLPSFQDVKDVLDLNDFVDFTAQVEQLHNAVHVWVGGHMGQIAYAAFDPIFWAHHTMIDRLWRLWQLRHPGSLPPASILDEALPPFRMTVRQTLSVTALGYDYAVASSSTQTP